MEEDGPGARSDHDFWVSVPRSQAAIVARLYADQRTIFAPRFCRAGRAYLIVELRPGPDRTELHLQPVPQPDDATRELNDSAWERLD
jgi:hypothetical protein